MRISAFQFYSLSEDDRLQVKIKRNAEVNKIWLITLLLTLVNVRRFTTHLIRLNICVDENVWGLSIYDKQFIFNYRSTACIRKYFIISYGNYYLMRKQLSGFCILFTIVKLKKALWTEVLIFEILGSGFAVCWSTIIGCYSRPPVYLEKYSNHQFEKFNVAVNTKPLKHFECLRWTHFENFHLICEQFFQSVRGKFRVNKDQTGFCFSVRIMNRECLINPKVFIHKWFLTFNKSRPTLEDAQLILHSNSRAKVLLQHQQLSKQELIELRCSSLLLYLWGDPYINLNNYDFQMEAWCNNTDYPDLINRRVR